MKFKWPSYFLAFVILNGSCANNSVEDKSEAVKSNGSPLLDCYRFANSGDTIILKLVHVGESITGTLVYKMPQKNTSKGAIQGKMSGDILIVEYTPLVDSSVIQQKVFKLTGNYFVEGSGETLIKNGEIKFKDIDNLKFIEDRKFHEINCE